jgi:mono/diheme cytochrome c family protein
MTAFSRNLALAGLAFAFAPDTAAATIEFNRDIRPILTENCFACHGPDPASRKAGLNLATREGAMGKKAVVSGNATASELIKRILSADPDEQMPPPDSHKKLTAGQKQILSDWIDAGAQWQAHWAFIAPVRASVPEPEGIKKWGRNPIDHFVLATQRNLGLEPNSGADKHTLARRAALDVTGLPPEAETLAAFLADDGDRAFGRYVETLIASKHSGEHRARYWLDAARYGDTHGMHVDNYREIWPYRDWVVQAFNDNMPFNRFVVEQLAGDLLPNATQDQRIATGFSRCNITTSEGGAIPEELNVRYMVDRVETTSTVFLGLTTGCAVCHDHKYDPISQKEFYSLGAFFNNTTQPPMDGNEKDTPPVVVLPSDENKKEWNSLLASRVKFREQLDKISAEADLKAWWAGRQHMGDHPVADDGLLLWLPLTERERDKNALAKDAHWADTHPAGRRGMRFDKSGGLKADLPALRTDEPFSISFWVRAPDKLQSSTIFDQLSSVPVGTDGKKKHAIGWRLVSSTQGAVTLDINDGKGRKISGLAAGEEALTPRKWQHVCVRYSGGMSDDGITIVVNGENRRLRNSTKEYCAPVEMKAVPIRLAPKFPTGGLSDLRVFKRWLTVDEIQVLADEFKIRKAMASDAKWSDLPAAQKEMLSRYREHTLDHDYRKIVREFAATQTRRDFIHSRSVTTLVMEERKNDVPRAWVLARGEYDQRRDEVRPNVPAALPALPKSAPRNRLSLANWLVDPKHPLTARVTMNRLWQSLFGTGLVKTSEDFGVMGDRPSHPELLDWLAVEFVESGWDVNHMLRLMLTSATYRQTAAASPESHQQDPDNRHLARGPRLRLDAEVLRDQILSVSGLLEPAFGGPAVKPYQPSGLWNIVAITGSNTRVFKQDTGSALYRRSLYTFWKRTSPPPSMAAFDAPTREQCTVRRERTNTPLQALVLLNDPQYVEAARHLAEHTIKAAATDKARAQWILEKALSKPGAKEDLNDILELVAEFKALFKDKPEAAKSLIASGDSKPNTALAEAELAAWTMAANVLMNRDDFINKN